MVDFTAYFDNVWKGMPLLSFMNVVLHVLRILPFTMIEECVNILNLVGVDRYKRCNAYALEYFQGFILIYMYKVDK